MTKDELEKFIVGVFNDQLDKDKNKILSKDDIRTIIREMLKKHYRLLWTNAPFYLDKL